MADPEEMPLPNLIKFGLNLATVKSVEICVPKCDFASTGIFAIYEVIYLPRKGSTFMFEGDVLSFKACELYPAIASEERNFMPGSRKRINLANQLEWRIFKLPPSPPFFVRERRFMAQCPILNTFMCFFYSPT